MNYFENILIGSMLTILLLGGLVTPTSAAAEENTVFRSLEFGDTQTTVRLKSLRDGFFSSPMVNLGGSALSPEGDRDLLVDEVPLNLIFFFNQKGLYRLDASGPEVAEHRFDTELRSHLDTLEKTITKRYGEPSFRKNLQPEDVSSGSFSTVAYWSDEDLEGNREIWVGVSGTDEGYESSLIVQDPKRSEAEPLSSRGSSPPELSRKQASNLF